LLAVRTARIVSAPSVFAPSGRWPLAPLLLCALPALAVAQEPSSNQLGVASISVNVRVVSVDAVARDSHNELVHHLTKDNFTISEDGKRQNIRYFTEDGDLPLTIGLMVDTSDSQRAYFVRQRIASQTFLTNMLTNPQDNAFVVRFDDDVLLLQKMTADLSLLGNALGRLPAPHPPRPNPDAGTLLFDGVCETAHDAFGEPSHKGFKSRPGHRALIILTDGDDNGSVKGLDEAIACAQASNIAVYTALYTSRDPGPQDEDDPRMHVSRHTRLMGRTNMERISRATGGRVFIVSRKLPIELIYTQIQEDLRSQYRIGYTPPSFVPGSYHTLQLKPRDKHFKIQARIGYYTPK
jgi:VWFA-related protein